MQSRFLSFRAVQMSARELRNTGWHCGHGKAGTMHKALHIKRLDDLRLLGRNELASLRVTQTSCARCDIQISTPPSLAVRPSPGPVTPYHIGQCSRQMRNEFVAGINLLVNVLKPNAIATIRSYSVHPYSYFPGLTIASVSSWRFYRDTGLLSSAQPAQSGKPMTKVRLFRTRLLQSLRRFSRIVDVQEPFDVTIVT
ncbi:hypothetical protein OE88DRAFT_1648115 [Heliocybe sulcata]|uniref:Uncharacterized protein n=1 Tax=Heliocybe sulcata TaxID=5364 RepID=A0A5C3MPB3_9AGAM|nr:hypothetical protein OE88DRAFT_1648115 [Heliocybe sulcata]